MAARLEPAPGLAIMAGLAERLPIRRGPKQGLVATMRNDVIDYRAGDDLTVALMFGA